MESGIRDAIGCKIVDGFGDLGDLNDAIAAGLFYLNLLACICC